MSAIYIRMVFGRKTTICCRYHLWFRRRINLKCLIVIPNDPFLMVWAFVSILCSTTLGLLSLCPFSLAPFFLFWIGPCSLGAF